MTLITPHFPTSVKYGLLCAVILCDTLIVYNCVLSHCSEPYSVLSHVDKLSRGVRFFLFLMCFFVFQIVDSTHISIIKNEQFLALLNKERNLQNSPGRRLAQSYLFFITYFLLYIFY